jgi:cytochrome c-type biogenesis protein CcmE
MSSKLARVLLTLLVIGGSLSYLFYTTLAQETEFYKHVDEVMTQPEQWYGKKMKLHGFVVDNSILVNSQTLEYRFDMQTNGHVIQAAYKGVVPDTFKSGAEVVLGGMLAKDGFHATDMTAKCPSKYDPKSATLGSKSGAAQGSGR